MPCRWPKRCYPSVPERGGKLGKIGWALFVCGRLGASVREGALLLCWPMNKLIVGFDKEIELPKGGFLLIDDEVPDIPRARVFDPKECSVNPLKGIAYKKARELADVLYTINAQGENTLTVRNGRREMLKALLDADRFDRVGGSEEIKGLVEDILASPVLRNVLCGHKNMFSLNPRSVVVARLNRAELGDFDALVLGLILMNLYEGQVVVKDFGFYGRDAHLSLIREKRLICGVNYLGELSPKLRRGVLLIKDKKAYRCIVEDAELLAEFSGKARGTEGFSSFVQEAIGNL